LDKSNQRKEPLTPPESLADIKANPPTVSFTDQPTDEADIAATRALIEQYTQPDGFHCPKCGAVIEDITEAIHHLADEMNKALAHLGGLSNP